MNHRSLLTFTPRWFAVQAYVPTCVTFFSFAAGSESQQTGITFSSLHWGFLRVQKKVPFFCTIKRKKTTSIKKLIFVVKIFFKAFLQAVQSGKSIKIRICGYKDTQNNATGVFINFLGGFNGGRFPAFAEPDHNALFAV